MWIDNAGYRIGQIGFLLLLEYSDSGALHYLVRETPVLREGTRAPILLGFAGTAKQVSAYARGVWCVNGINSAGTRVRLSQLTGDTLRAWLQSEGYPELTEGAE